eukprot:3034782-Amphidinium_carterae.3
MSFDYGSLRFRSAYKLESVDEAVCSLHDKYLQRGMCWMPRFLRATPFPTCIRENPSDDLRPERQAFPGAASKGQALARRIYRTSSFFRMQCAVVHTCCSPEVQPPIVSSNGMAWVIPP